MDNNDRDEIWNNQKRINQIKNAEPGQYDLILMDIQMPILNGYEATKQIRALEDSDFADIPIIAMTGHIAKPIDVPKLLELLKEILIS